MPIRSYVLPETLVQRVLAHKRARGFADESDAARDLIEAGLALQPDTQAQGCPDEREVEKAQTGPTRA